MDATATSTACCDLDLWPPESNPIISRGETNIHCRFNRACSIHPWDIVVTRSVWMNEWTNAVDGRPKNIMPLPMPMSGGINKQICQSSLLSGRNIRWPCRMLLPGESQSISMPMGQTRHHTITVCFPLDAIGVIIWKLLTEFISLSKLFLFNSRVSPHSALQRFEQQQSKLIGKIQSVLHKLILGLIQMKIYAKYL